MVNIKEFKDRPAGRVEASFRAYEITSRDLLRLRQPHRDINHMDLWLNDSVSIRNKSIKYSLNNWTIPHFICYIIHN